MFCFLELKPGLLKHCKIGVWDKANITSGTRNFFNFTYFYFHRQVFPVSRRACWDERVRLKLKGFGSGLCLLFLRASSARGYFLFFYCCKVTLVSDFDCQLLSDLFSFYVKSLGYLANPVGRATMHYAVVLSSPIHILSKSAILSAC